MSSMVWIACACCGRRYAVPVGTVVNGKRCAPQQGASK